MEFVIARKQGGFMDESKQISRMSDNELVSEYARLSREVSEFENDSEECCCREGLIAEIEIIEAIMRSRKIRFNEMA